MKCPICKTAALKETELDSKLTALQCSKCSGIWIPAIKYRKWIDQFGSNIPENKTVSSNIVSDAGFEKIRVCPECGAFLGRYEVGHGVSFKIDHCGRCGGFWLDKGEYEALKARNLHDDIHSIYLNSWQEGLRKARTENVINKRLAAAMGENDYTEMRRVKEWLVNHPQKALILAYLTE
jgi:Zn-finger nucleic acid-binding protein